MVYFGQILILIIIYLITISTDVRSYYSSFNTSFVSYRNRFLKVTISYFILNLLLQVFSIPPVWLYTTCNLSRAIILFISFLCHYYRCTHLNLFWHVCTYYFHPITQVLTLRQARPAQNVQFLPIWSKTIARQDW